MQGEVSEITEVFLHTYWNWMKGQSLVKDESEEHMNPKAGAVNEDGSLLQLLREHYHTQNKNNM